MEKRKNGIIISNITKHYDGTFLALRIQNIYFSSEEDQVEMFGTTVGHLLKKMKNTDFQMHERMNWMVS